MPVMAQPAPAPLPARASARAQPGPLAPTEPRRRSVPLRVAAPTAAGRPGTPRSAPPPRRAPSGTAGGGPANILDADHVPSRLPPQHPPLAAPAPARLVAGAQAVQVRGGPGLVRAASDPGDDGLAAGRRRHPPDEPAERHTLLCARPVAVPRQAVVHRHHVPGTGRAGTAHHLAPAVRTGLDLAAGVVQLADPGAAPRAVVAHLDRHRVLLCRTIGQRSGIWSSSQEDTPALDPPGPWT